MKINMDELVRVDEKSTYNNSYYKGKDSNTPTEIFIKCDEASTSKDFTISISKTGLKTSIKNVEQSGKILKFTYLVQNNYEENGRPQQVIHYGKGEIAWDYPEMVPAFV